MRNLKKIASCRHTMVLIGCVLGPAPAYAADPIQTTRPECVTPTNDMAVEGRRAFMRMNCYSCHGLSGHGGSMGPNLVGKSDETDVVIEGDGHGMPAFQNNLCRNDLANLTAYLNLLGTGSEPTFTHWWEPGPNLPTR